MQCERLIQMIKSWYIHVREETMAPARMVSFMEKHAETCDICLQDPDVKEEIAKITEIVLPESKIPKAVRQQNQASDDDDEEQDDQDDSESDDDENEDDDEDEDLDVDDELLSDSKEN
jgi:hypothetical protein